MAGFGQNKQAEHSITGRTEGRLAVVAWPKTKQNKRKQKKITKKKQCQSWEAPFAFHVLSAPFIIFQSKAKGGRGHGHGFNTAEAIGLSPLIWLKPYDTLPPWWAVTQLSLLLQNTTLMIAMVGNRLCTHLQKQNRNRAAPTNNNPHRNPPQLNCGAGPGLTFEQVVA